MKAARRCFPRSSEVPDRKRGERQRCRRTWEDCAHESRPRGYADVAAILLENGADPELKDEYGATALIITASEGHVDTARALLDHKADTHAKDKNGWTAWLWAFSPVTRKS